MARRKPSTAEINIYVECGWQFTTKAVVFNKIISF